MGPIYKSKSKFSIRPGDDYVGGQREDVRILSNKVYIKNIQ